MKMPEYREIAFGVCLGLMILTGCEQRSDEPASENRPVSRSLREPRVNAASSRASQDDSLYRQIVETMQQENKALKQQVQETAEKCAQLETQLNDMKLERDVAFRAYLKVSESINSLKTDASSKDKRIQELEQSNLIQQETIAQLNQQLAQLLSELSTTGLGTNTVNDPNL
ncbi:MAG: hypothetical protein K9N55_09375 [Phycisphaerae bacterium]|nr:hypothetical protein [Phycisphaerae bacterium]